MFSNCNVDAVDCTVYVDSIGFRGGTETISMFRVLNFDIDNCFASAAQIATLDMQTKSGHCILYLHLHKL